MKIYVLKMKFYFQDVFILITTVVVMVNSYTVLAAAKQSKKQTKFITPKGELKLWHVEMLTEQKQSFQRLTQFSPLSLSPWWLRV